MSPLSLSRAAQFVCSGCHTTESRRGPSWEQGTALAGSRRGVKRCCHQSLLHLRSPPPERLLLQLPGKLFLQHLTWFFSPLPSPWLCFLSVLPNPSLAAECNQPYHPPPQITRRLKNQRQEGSKKNKYNCFLCLLGFPLALVPLIKFGGSPLMRLPGLGGNHGAAGDLDKGIWDT